MKNITKSKIYLILIILFLIASICVVLIGLRNTPKKTVITVTEPPIPTHIKEIEKIVQVEKIVEVEKNITSEIIQDGLNDMGVLITQAYYFTDVIGYTSVKKFLKTEIELPFTETSYLASYDGVVTAGIDFSAIQVSKNDDTKQLVISIPHASIQNVDIDPNSFQLYSEKTGLCNPISAADFNQSLVELESTARQKALNRNLLTQADSNTRKVVQNFIQSMVDISQYRIQYESI